MPASLSRQRYVNQVTQSTNLRLSMTVASKELSFFYQWLRVCFLDCMCSLISAFMRPVTYLHNWPKLAAKEQARYFRAHCIHDSDERSHSSAIGFQRWNTFKIKIKLYHAGQNTCQNCLWSYFVFSIWERLHVRCLVKGALQKTNKKKTWKVMGWPSVNFIQDGQKTFLPPTCVLFGSSFVCFVFWLIKWHFNTFCIFVRAKNVIVHWYLYRVGTVISTAVNECKSRVWILLQTCLAWKSPFLSQLGMGIVKRSSCVRVFDANLSNALCSSARHGACEGTFSNYYLSTPNLIAGFCCDLKKTLAQNTFSVYKCS